MAPKMGPRYRIEIADPKGIRWMAIKKVVKEITPTNPRRNKNLG